MTEGRPATATHDYLRHGTTTLFAALDVLDGTVSGRCMQRHRHQEVLRFLNAVEGFSATLAKRRLRRGSFSSLADLQVVIGRYLAEANVAPRPFVQTAEAEGIIEKVRRGDQAARSLHG